MPSPWLSFLFTFLFLLLVISVVGLALIALAPGREEEAPPPLRRHALAAPPDTVVLWSSLPPLTALQPIQQQHQPIAFQPNVPSQSQLSQAQAPPPAAGAAGALQVPALASAAALPASTAGLEQPLSLQQQQQLALAEGQQQQSQQPQQQAALFHSQPSSLPQSPPPAVISTAATDSAAQPCCELCTLSATPSNLSAAAATAAIATHTHTHANPRLTPEEHKQLQLPRSPSNSPPDSWIVQQEQLRLYSARIAHITNLEGARAQSRQADWQLSPQIVCEVTNEKAEPSKTTASTTSKDNQQAERKGQDA